MSKNQLRLTKSLPAIIFILIPTICIFVGWLLGISFGHCNPELWHEGYYHPSPSQAIVLGGIAGGLWGVLFGSFVSFGGFGLLVGWIWRKKYAKMNPGYMLLIVIGWLFAPSVLCIMTMFFLLMM